MFILRLETFARVTEPTALNAVSTCTVALVCLPSALLLATDASQPVEQLANTSAARVLESLALTAFASETVSEQRRETSFFSTDLGLECHVFKLGKGCFDQAQELRRCGQLLQEQPPLEAK